MPPLSGMVREKALLAPMFRLFSAGYATHAHALDDPETVVD
ncbi:hypothetical protein ACXPWS_08780 [Mycobacterium sp. BMJ-28]